MNLFDKESLYKIVKIDEEDDDVFEKIIYNFLAINKDFILENTVEFTVDDLWYSEYYWLHRLKEKNKKYDAGIDQQLFNLVEIIANNIDIEWSIINDIEENKI